MILAGLVLIQIGLTLLQTAMLIGVINRLLSRQLNRDSVLAEEVGQLRYQVNDLLAVLKQQGHLETTTRELHSSYNAAEQSVSDRESERFRDHPAPPLGTHVNLSGK